jgi:hypothetical protein
VSDFKSLRTLCLVATGAKQGGQFTPGVQQLPCSAQE